MNTEQFAGICRQFAGRLNEVWGELTGDSLRAATGRRDQIVGKARQLSAIVNEQSARQLREFLHYHRNWYF